MINSMINNNNTTWNQDYYNDEELEYLSKNVTGTFKIDLNGFINVDGSVNLINENLTEILFKFGKVTGNFDCSLNKLESLKGAPYHVGVHFYCSNNKLTSLEYAPKHVGSNFHCWNNNRKLSIIEVLKYIQVTGMILN